MSYLSRVYRQRNPHVFESETNRDEDHFFSNSKDKTNSKVNKPGFFQPKLAIGQPNDAYEKEADAVASAVVNHQPSNAPVIQQKEISSIQRLATPLEEEKLSTNDERMKKGKEIQEKPEIQQKENSHIQRLATPLEEEKLSTNDERMKRDKEIQEKPELQMMCPECEKEKKEGTVQAKSEGGGAASPQLSSKIENSAGNGNSLPKKALYEMSNSFGVDFSHVNIHTDSEAVQMNKELGAHAFTHGSDIYFNSGKYDAETTGGKQLLAHELTHVVQQTGSINQKLIQKSADTCTYGEMRQYAYLNQAGFPAPTGLGDMKASLGAACSRGNSCSCYSGAAATGAQDQAAWRNIVAATGNDQSNGANIICVDTQNCSLVQNCRPIYQPGQPRPPLRRRTTPLVPVATLTLNGGTVYFYSDPRNGNCP
jgi:uncharacterized protein YlaI